MHVYLKSNLIKVRYRETNYLHVKQPRQRETRAENQSKEGLVGSSPRDTHQDQNFTEI